MLRKVNLEITVLDYDRIGGSDPIGKVMLGYNRKKLEKKHWAEMVDNPRRPIIHWHVLQASKEPHRNYFLCNGRLGGWRVKLASLHLYIFRLIRTHRKFENKFNQVLSTWNIIWIDSNKDTSIQT